MVFRDLVAFYDIKLNSTRHLDSLLHVGGSTQFSISVWFTDREYKNFEEDAKAFLKFFISRFGNYSKIHMHSYEIYAIKVHTKPFLRTENSRPAYYLSGLWGRTRISSFP